MTWINSKHELQPELHHAPGPRVVTDRKLRNLNRIRHGRWGAVARLVLAESRATSPRVAGLSPGARIPAVDAAGGSRLPWTSLPGTDLPRGQAGAPRRL